MPTYKIRFSGRKKGAIGLTYETSADVEADNVPAAVIRLYDAHEHIENVRVNVRLENGGLDPLTMDRDGRQHR